MVSIAHMWLLQPKNLLPMLAIVTVAAIFQSLSGNFLTFANLQSIGNQLAIILLLALGGTFVLMMGSLDLSITSIMAVSGVVTVQYFSTYGLGAVLIGILVGVLLGLLNGMIFVVTRIPSFIVTIGTMMIYSGIALELSGGHSVQIYDPAFRAMAVGEVAGVDLMLVWALLILALSMFIFFRTGFGRRTHAIGANIETARRAGIEIASQRVWVFTISGLFCGIAGILAVAWSAQSSAGTGTNLLLPAVAAMVIAGNPITGGVGGPHRTFLGALLLSMLSNGLNVLRVPIDIQTIIFGVVVVTAIVATVDRERVRFVR